MMAYFAKIRIWINLRTAVGTCRLADGLSTLGTEHSLGIVDSSAERTLLANGLLLLLLLLKLHLHRAYWLLRPIGSRQHFLGTDGSFHAAIIEYIIVYHLSFIKSQMQN